MTWANRILSFYQSLYIENKIPRDVEVMNPYQDNYAFSLCKKFYHKFYDDDNKRLLIFGINPGRFGSGTTGISFTDPIKLEKECGIENNFPKKAELSADFIYAMIHAYGGIATFYKDYFITSLSPLGFTKNGKNINYYDESKLEKAVTPFVIQSISEVVTWNINREKCFCLGEGKNYKFLTKLNDKHQWFKEVVPLPHPRFIMQYRRKFLQTYINQYIAVLKE